MSSWKEWQLALADESKTDEETAEYERAWLYDCRKDYEKDLALEQMERNGEEL